MKNQKNQSLIHALRASQDMTWFQVLKKVNVFVYMYDCVLGEGREGVGDIQSKNTCCSSRLQTSYRDLSGNILILQSKIEIL